MQKLGTFFMDILEVVVFAIGIFFFVYLLIMRPHKIKGQSMDPTFPDGEYLLTEKVSYYSRNPIRGDVVVFKAPPEISEDDEYIKRVIGLPGDKIMIQDGKVYVNNEMLNEYYLSDTLYTSDGAFLKEGQEYTVPEARYMVFGDNRPHSLDSRAFGPITKSTMSGRAWVVYWPVKQAGVVPKIKY